MAQIMTVDGPVDVKDMGFTLPHEHIIVDFGGADTAGPHRYNPDDVVERMLPYVREAQAAGVGTFIDCSPMFLARDVRILRRLSAETGMKFVTNTGQYKEPYLPAETFELPAESLAEAWTSEWTDGIDGTDVKPGFVKTAVFPDPLAPVQTKIIEAAALTSKATGLAIGTHTCAGIPALQIQRILERFGVSPQKWIFIHAHLESDFDLIKKVAREGSWIELDGLGNYPDSATLSTLIKLLDAGFEKQILLSHDAGWYTVGEPDGGTPRGYTYLSETFVPLMESVGISRELIRVITAENPGRAFAFD